jgi:hypothetical protein
MNYTWNIVHIKTKDYPDMPKALHWCRVEYIGTDENGNTGRHELGMPFPVPTPETYVPFENLTEQGIIDRFVNNLSQEHWEHMQGNIAYEISNQIKKQEFLPWQLSDL